MGSFVYPMAKIKERFIGCSHFFDNICRWLLTRFHFQIEGRRKFKGINGVKSAYFIIFADLFLAFLSFIAIGNETTIVFLTNVAVFVKNIFIFKRESRILEDEYYKDSGHEPTKRQKSPYDKLQNISVILIVICLVSFVILAFINEKSGTRIVQLMKSLVVFFTTLFTFITNGILDLSKIYITRATFTVENLSERI